MPARVNLDAVANRELTSVLERAAAYTLTTSVREHRGLDPVNLDHGATKAPTATSAQVVSPARSRLTSPGP